MKGIPVIDPYDAYQVLDDAWAQIRIDLEILQTEGDAALAIVDPNMVTKKKDDKTVEVQDGWVGRILPFDLVQRRLLPDELEALEAKQAELSDIAAVYEEIIDSLTDEERDSKILNDNNLLDYFVFNNIKSAVKFIDDDSHDTFVCAERRKCFFSDEQMISTAHHLSTAIKDRVKGCANKS